MVLQIKKYKIFVLGYILYIFVYLSPYYIWGSSFFLYLSILLSVFGFVISKSNIINTHKIKYTFIYLISFIILYSISIFKSNCFPPSGYYIKLVYICLFLCLEEKIQIKIFNIFIQLFAILLAMSILEYIFLINGYGITLGTIINVGQDSMGQDDGVN